MLKGYYELNSRVVKQWGTGKNDTWRWADSGESAAFYKNSQAATGSCICFSR